MTYSCNTGYEAGGESVQLMHETFDGCDLNTIDSVSGFDGWKMQSGYAISNSCNEGALTFDPINGDEYSSVTIDLTVATGNICAFESTGDMADHIYVQYWDGNCWVTLDTYTRSGDVMLGDQTGQTFNGSCWSTISYTVDNPNDDLQFRVVTDVTATDEIFGVTEMSITAVPKPEPVCEPVLTSFLYENFDAYCDPAQSQNVLWDDGWDIHYGSAYADGCNDGALVFNTVNAADQDSVTFSFDIAAGNLCNWESCGDSMDYVQVYVTQNGCWELLETFIRDGDVVRGVMTGQTFNSHSWTNVSFTVDTPEDCMAFAVVANLTAQDEYLWLDNASVTGSKLECEVPVDGGGGSVVELGSIGDKVWLDLDGDGVQDADEAGVAGVTVELLKDGVSTGRTVVTDANGEYLFDELEAGNYSIQVSGVAEGYRLVDQNAGGDDLADSDVDASGLSETYALAESEHYRGLDAGIEAIPLGSLGDVVWLDADGDGVQDEGETGVAGVTVELLKDGVATGRSVVTDASGAYLFGDLEAGTYAVQLSGLAEGYEFTAQNAAAEALDSDVDASGLSSSYTLAEGEDYFDLDAGVRAIAPVLADDAAGTCWTETRDIDVLANDQAGVTITAIDGTAVAAGGAVTLASGAVVTLNADGTLTYDGIDAFSGLSVGDMAMDGFTYTAETAQGGVSEASVSVDICADTIRSVDDVAALTPESVTFTVYDLVDEGGMFAVTVDGGVDVRFSHAYATDIYCVDVAGDVFDGVALTAEVFLADADDAALGEYVQNVENLDLVNYVLNQDYADAGYSSSSVQNAIWFLTDDYFSGYLEFIDADAAAIVADAQANGEGFEAASGDLVGLILAPVQAVDDAGVETSNYQNFIYGLDYDSFTECLCV